MSKIFEEAIADAKKLKEVAEENAKKAILESVTPKIKEFIEEQLLEGEKEEDSEEESEDKDEAAGDLEETVYLDESALSSIVNLLGEDVLDSLNESKSKTALINSVKGAVAGMSDRERSTLLNASNKINENANNLSSRKGEDMSRKYYEVDLRTLREALDEEESYDDGMEESDMLGELARLFEQGEDADLEGGEGQPLEDDLGVEEEADAGGEGETLLKSEVEAEIEELIASLGLNIGGLDEGGAAAEGGEDLDLAAFEELDAEPPAEGGEEDALNEMVDVDPRILRQEINRVKRMMNEADAKQSKVSHHFGGKGSGNAGYKNAFGGSGAKKMGYSKSFGGAAPGKDVFVNPPQINKLNEAIRKLSRQNRAQAEKLDKYRGAVNSLREQLEELNLFNAKLLYVNKLLQNKSLNESQKKSVIKALDEAQSLQEAKSLYSSLTQTLGQSAKKSTLSESRILGSSSRTLTSSQTSVSKNDELSRWQRLAGL